MFHNDYEQTMKPFKDVDEAAIKWQKPELRDEYLERWFKEAKNVYDDELLPDSYKLGWVWATLEAIKAHLIHTGK
mgnify:FL=1